MFTSVYRPNFFLNIAIPCYIFIKLMSLSALDGGGGEGGGGYLHVRIISCVR